MRDSRTIITHRYSPGHGPSTETYECSQCGERLRKKTHGCECTWRDMAALERKLEEAHKVIEDACLSVGETRSEFIRLRAAADLLDLGPEWTPISGTRSPALPSEPDKYVEVKITYGRCDNLIEERRT